MRSPAKSDTLKLTEELIARASVSPTDGGCQALMIERLEAIGFEVEPLRFGPVDNFWATRGSGAPVTTLRGRDAREHVTRGASLAGS